MTHDERMHQLLYSNEGRVEQCERICKLEELVRELWTYAEQELLCDENCPYGTVCDWRNCVFERRMRELGVEL